MPKISEDLRDAQALAEFSNLARNNVEYFRHNYPDFVPQAWWNYQPIIRDQTFEAEGPSDITPSGRVRRHRRPQWALNQQWLQKAWENNFNDVAFSMVRLLLSVFEPNSKILRDRPPFARLEDVFRFKPFTYPYQKAVLFLYEHPWRAKFCLWCQKRFVAIERNSRYCSERCSHEAHTRQELKSYHKNKDKYRAKREGITPEPLVKRVKSMAAHHHIRWANGKLDGERFDTLAEIEDGAKRLKELKGFEQTYTVEEYPGESCPVRLCSRTLNVLRYGCDFPTMEEIEEADLEKLDLWYQVLPSLPYGDTPERKEILHRVAERIKKLGGVTSEVSTKIGFGGE